MNIYLVGLLTMVVSLTACDKSSSKRSSSGGAASASDFEFSDKDKVVLDTSAKEKMQYAYDPESKVLVRKEVADAKLADDSDNPKSSDLTITMTADAHKSLLEMLAETTEGLKSCDLASEDGEVYTVWSGKKWCKNYELYTKIANAFDAELQKVGDQVGKTSPDKKVDGDQLWLVEGALVFKSAGVIEMEFVPETGEIKMIRTLTETVEARDEALSLGLAATALSSKESADLLADLNALGKKHDCKETRSLALEALNEPGFEPESEPESESDDKKSKQTSPLVSISQRDRHCDGSDLYDGSAELVRQAYEKLTGAMGLDAKKLIEVTKTSVEKELVWQFDPAKGLIVNVDRQRVKNKVELERGASEQLFAVIQKSYGANCGGGLGLVDHDEEKSQKTGVADETHVDLGLMVSQGKLECSDATFVGDVTRALSDAFVSKGTGGASLMAFSKDEDVTLYYEVDKSGSNDEKEYRFKADDRELRREGNMVKDKKVELSADEVDDLIKSLNQLGKAVGTCDEKQGDHSFYVKTDGKKCRNKEFYNMAEKVFEEFF